MALRRLRRKRRRCTRFLNRAIRDSSASGSEEEEESIFEVALPIVGSAPAASSGQEVGELDLELRFSAIGLRFRMWENALPEKFITDDLTLLAFSWGGVFV